MAILSSIATISHELAADNDILKTAEMSMASSYGKKSADKVEKAMHERKAGTLKSGGSGKTVKSKKQAIAIGLSEARKEGGKVPAKKSAAKKGARKTASKKKS